jgi:hypothetical protein
MRRNTPRSIRLYDLVLDNYSLAKPEDCARICESRERLFLGGLGLVGRGGPACPIGHVQADGMYAMVGTEAGQRLVQGLLPHISNNHLHSGCHKGLGHPQAHATRAASDEGGLSCNVFHVGFSWVDGFSSSNRRIIAGLPAVHADGRTFAFNRNRFVGSYLFLIFTRRG